VNKTAKVVVNKLPSDSLLTDGGVVCSDMENASVRVYGTQRNVVYQAYDPIKPIGAAVTSRGGEITLVLPVADLQKGANKIVVRASVDACATVTLKDTADVFINTLPDPNISVTGSSVCPGQDGTVTLTPTQLNVEYSVLVNGVTTSSTAIGNGSEKTIVVPFTLLTKRNNEITVSADIKACRTVTLARKGYIGSIMKDGPGISGDSILCFGDTASYSVEPIENAVAYNWTIRSKNGLAKFITDNSKRKVTVQADTFNFRLRMTPVSTFGTCETVAFEDSITVEDTVKGVGSIWGRDTVCVNDIDTLHIEGIRNATSYLWHYPKSDQVDVMKVFYTDTVYAEKLVNNVLVKDTIYTTTTYSRHKVQYLESGLQTFYVKPFMRCKNINGAYADSVVKVVKVLENAVAEAGEYVDPQFTAEANFIQLNGAGSSTDSRKDTLNKYSYKWYTDAKTPGQILNQTTLYDATLKPEVEETKVYLLVTNRNGLCPAKDSTTIKVQFDIDIPNVFSPNGDGNHDFFEIKNLNKLYPDAVLTIFNKWGSVVYVSGAGYPEPWDGKRNGEDMPVATYYYILDTKGGRTYSPGSVTIIR
jgi:gliding motility-associated-like protein